jgi:hypothetical protein
MTWGILAVSAALVLGPSTAAGVAPPSTPGPWHQVGAAVTSRPGKPLHFYRTVEKTKAVGIVARSSSARPIRLSWSSYCEVESDDVMTEELQGTKTGVHSVTIYPHVLVDATLCYVWVNVKATANVRVAAAVFAH